MWNHSNRNHGVSIQLMGDTLELHQNITDAMTFLSSNMTNMHIRHHFLQTQVHHTSNSYSRQCISQSISRPYTSIKRHTKQQRHAWMHSPKFKVHLHHINSYCSIHDQPNSTPVSSKSEIQQSHTSNGYTWPRSKGANQITWTHSSLRTHNDFYIEARPTASL